MKENQRVAFSFATACLSFCCLNLILLFTPNLDLATVARTMAFFLWLAVMVGSSVFFQLEYLFDTSYSKEWDVLYFLRIQNTWPFLIAALWMSVWPTLDHWAALKIPSFYDPKLWPKVWWNEWYVRWGIWLGLIATGFGAKSFWQNRHSTWP